MRSLLDYTDERLIEDTESRMREITDFLRFLYSNAEADDVFEIRTLTHSKQTDSDLFYVKELDDDNIIAKMVITNENNAGEDLKGIYATINVADASAHTKRTLTDKDIKKILNFVIDIDVHDRILETEEKVILEGAVTSVAKEMFEKQGIAYLVNDSGFGYHVFVKLKPIPVDSDEVKVAYKKVATELATEFFNKLKEKTDIVKNIDTSVYNLSRIMRVAFTKNIRIFNDEKYLALDKIIVKKDGGELDLGGRIQKEIERLMRVDESVFIDEKSALTKEDIERVVQAVKLYYRPGRRHNLVLGLSAFLYWRGVDYNSAKAVITKLAQETEDNELNDRLRALDDTYNTDRLKSYRTHFLNALQDENKMSELIYKLNNALSEYYARKKERHIDNFAITTVEAVMSGEFSIYNFLIEHTIDIIKQVDNKTGNISFKIVLFDDKKRSSTIVTIKDLADKLYNDFNIINKHYFHVFGHFIIDKDSIDSLEKSYRDKVKQIIKEDMKKYSKFVVDHARLQIQDEFEDVKNEFFDIIEYHANKIIKIASIDAISNETLLKLLDKFKLVFDESNNKIYMSHGLISLSEKADSFARKLAKMLHSLNIIKEQTLRSVRKFRRARGKRFTFYELDAQRFFELLNSENVDYEIVEFDPSILENEDDFEIEEVIEE